MRQLLGGLLSVLLAIGLILTTIAVTPVSAAIAAPLPLAAIFHFSGKRPPNLGVQAGQLAVCPASPNCVSSQATDDGHQIAPIAWTGTAQEGVTKLKALVAAQPGAEIITETETYLYAEFTSSLMGFVDDLEFFVDPEQQVIQVRSASRLGESDLGVNRQRVETIRAGLQG
ncbi:MAG: DUF1499 domain-containing protein [Synechococcales bacterium]|nr:DUF1499 domain-containing protein [Synechococcales bacterium]